MNKIQVLYICSKRAKELPLLAHAKNIQFKKVKIHVKSMIGISLLRSIFNTWIIMRTFRPDLILVEGAGFFSGISVLLKKIFKIPLAVRLKGDLWKEYSEIKYDIPLTEKIIKLLNYKAGVWVLKNADAILSISNYIKKVTEKNLKNYKGKLYVIHIPYRKIEDNFPTNIEEKFILSVTNFNFWGKVEPMVKLIPHIYPILQKLNIKWIIVGDGFFFKKCLNLSKKFLESGHIKFMGRQNPVKFYKSALFLLYISGMDGLPNVLLEASLFKLPIVIDKNSPAAEFIKNGYNGLVVNCENVKEVENVIKHLISSQKLREKLGITAFNHVKKNFSVEKISSDLEKVLYKIK